MKSVVSWGRLDMIYKKTVFGKIPSDWSVSTIGVETLVVTDYVANGSFASLAENVTYHNTKDFATLIRLVDYNNGFKDDLVYIDEKAYEFLGKSKLFGGEIIISNVGANAGTVFKCPHLPTYMSLAPNAIMVKFKGNDDFYFHWLRGYQGQRMLRSIITGSAQPKFNKTNFRAMPIPVPPIAVQDKIANILNLLDYKIEINNKINNNLHQQTIAIYKKWFLDSPKAAKWPFVMLDDITSLVSRGITPKYASDSKQIVLNQKCIRDHSIDISLARSHTPKAITEKWLQYGDLLINSTGEGTLGRAAQVWFIPENITVDSHVTIVRPKTQLLLFYIGLWGITHEREIEALHIGSTGQTELPRDRVKAMELRLPDGDLLAKFNSTIQPMVSAVVANQRENVRLSGIRDEVLPKLMSGEIDVSDIQL